VAVALQVKEKNKKKTSVQIEKTLLSFHVVAPRFEWKVFIDPEMSGLVDASS
jgi:hypothetical protein